MNLNSSDNDGGGGIDALDSDWFDYVRDTVIFSKYFLRRDTFVSSLTLKTFGTDSGLFALNHPMNHHFTGSG